MRAAPPLLCIQIGRHKLTSYCQACLRDEPVLRCCLRALCRSIFCPRPITLLFPARRWLWRNLIGDFIPRFFMLLFLNHSLSARQTHLRRSGYGSGVVCVRAAVALFQRAITILINLAFCITPEPGKCVGKDLLPIEQCRRPAGSLCFPWDHQTGKKNDQCAFLIPPRSESCTEGRGYYLS